MGEIELQQCGRRELPGVGASAALATGAVPVRDSKDTSIPGFTVSGSAWSTFVGSLKTQG